MKRRINQCKRALIHLLQLAHVFRHRLSNTFEIFREGVSATTFNRNPIIKQRRDKRELKYLHVEVETEAGAVRMMDRKMEAQGFAHKKLELKDRLRRAFQDL